MYSYYSEGKEFSCDVPSGHNVYIFAEGELRIGQKDHSKTAESLILLQRY